jgi:hypothetical protein
MKVYIYSGVPGSGKSTLVREHHAGAIVCSADHHFTDDDGVYRFDPTQLPEAHGACLRKFAGYAAIGGPGDPDLVVDNTNTTVAEIAPYAALALAYGHELLVVTVECDPAVAAARNTHGVPEAAVKRMAASLAARQLPPWWKHEVYWARATPGTGQACGSANACVVQRGHGGQHEDCKGDRWGFDPARASWHPRERRL